MKCYGPRYLPNSTWVVADPIILRSNPFFYFSSENIILYFDDTFLSLALFYIFNKGFQWIRFLILVFFLVREEKTKNFLNLCCIQLSFHLVLMQGFSSNITRGMKEQRDRPYACNICEKKFCRSTHLRRHQTKSHGRIPNPNRVEGYYRNVHKAAVDSQNSDNIYYHHNVSQWNLLKFIYYSLITRRMWNLERERIIVTALFTSKTWTKHWVQFTMNK